MNSHLRIKSYLIENSLCIKYGFKGIEMTEIGGIQTENVRHLGNYFDYT